MNKKKIISLFDYTGTIVEPWRQAGYECHIFDLRHREGKTKIKEGLYTYGGDIISHKSHITDMTDIKFLMAFPPCTDLAVSGARWFKRKKELNAAYREEAMALVYFAKDIAETLKATYFIENPISVISTEWRKPDYIFQPWHYTKIAPKDNYTKTTCLWTGNGYKHPPKQIDFSLGEPDNKYIHYLGSKRGTIGSNTPKGFSEAMYLENYNGN